MTPTPSHVATDELIETLERLEKEATPGPWKHKKSVHGNKYRYVEIGDEGTYTTLELEPGDARLIAALRNHLPALISALKENKRLREALSECVNRFESIDRYVEKHGSPPYFGSCAYDAAHDMARAALQPQGEK